MTIEKKLAFAQNICVIVAVSAIFVVMFLIGDTDVGAEAPSPWITAMVSATAALAAAIYALIQFIGIPSIENASNDQAKRN